MFLPDMSIAAILFNCVEPFEQIGKTLFTEGPMRYLLKIIEMVSEKKIIKNYTFLYMYIAQWQGQVTLWRQNFDYILGEKRNASSNF